MPWTATGDKLVSVTIAGLRSTSCSVVGQGLCTRAYLRWTGTSACTTELVMLLLVLPFLLYDTTAL